MTSHPPVTSSHNIRSESHCCHQYLYDAGQLMAPLCLSFLVFKVETVIVLKLQIGS